MTTHVLSKNVIVIAVACVAILACAGPARAPREAQPAATPRGGTAVPAREPGERATAVDADGDGRPELWRLETPGPGGRLAGTEEDANGDGRADRWVRFGADGAPALVAADVDFDGRADVTFRYAAGALVAREDAIPGLPRTWSTYEAGRLVRVERDLDGDGRPDAVERVAAETGPGAMP